MPFEMELKDAALPSSCLIDDDCEDGEICLDMVCVPDEPVCMEGDKGDLCTVDSQCCSGKCKGNGTCR